jgi:hypothetical protein
MGLQEGQRGMKREVNGNVRCIVASERGVGNGRSFDKATRGAGRRWREKADGNKLKGQIYRRGKF